MKFAFASVHDISIDGIIERLSYIPEERIDSANLYMQSYSHIKRLVLNCNNPITMLHAVWAWMPSSIKLLVPCNKPYEVIPTFSAWFYKTDNTTFPSYGMVQELMSVMDRPSFAAVSKILHFIRPDKFAMFDSVIRQSYSVYDIEDPEQIYMEYVIYISKLRSLISNFDPNSENYNETDLRKIAKYLGEDVNRLVSDAGYMRMIEASLYHIGMAAKRNGECK